MMFRPLLSSAFFAVSLSSELFAEGNNVVEEHHIDRFARLALDCVHREYPNKISHLLNQDGDVKPPRQLTPVFYGCLDWHSAVHGHWLLVRLCRLYPKGRFVQEARSALQKSFTAAKVAAEVAYFNGEGRKLFERPYGLAWLLQLATELHEWQDPEAERWAATLEPLTLLAAERFKEWLPKLSYPIRTGEHSQTAFAMGLVLDWARATGERAMAALVEERARHYYLRDRAWNLAFEPGGQDFLSPGLAEADLMRRVLERGEFLEWLDGFLPELRESTDSLQPAVVSDPTDGKLAHLDGLNLSRAWMLEGIASALPETEPLTHSILSLAQRHREAGLKAVTGEHYEGGHWLGSFALYLVTQRGLTD